MADFPFSNLSSVDPSVLTALDVLPSGSTGGGSNGQRQKFDPLALHFPPYDPRGSTGFFPATLAGRPSLNGADIVNFLQANLAGKGQQNMPTTVHIEVG